MIERARVWRKLCCRVLQCAAVCCSVLQCVAVSRSVLQCGALCRSVLQRAAVCYSVLEGLSPLQLTPSTQSDLFSKLTCFFHVETHKVSTSIRGGSHVLLHKPCHEEVHSAHSSYTAPERVRNWLEFG